MSVQRTAHRAPPVEHRGLAQGPAVAHSVLSTDWLRTAILPAYDLGAVRECRLLQHNQNDTYLVHADHGRFILKIYEARGAYTPRGHHIPYELDLLRYLHQHGVSVAPPVVRRDRRYLGRLAAPEGRRTAVLFNNAVGQPVPATAWDEAFGQNLGSTVGAMHVAVDDFASQLPRFRLNQRYLLAWPVRLARPFFAHRPDDWAYVRGLARQLTSRLEALADAGLSQGICHGDIAGKTNVHLSPDGALTLFDFECCGPGLARVRHRRLSLGVGPTDGTRAGAARAGGVSRR